MGLDVKRTEHSMSVLQSEKTYYYSCFLHLKAGEGSIVYFFQIENCLINPRLLTDFKSVGLGEGVPRP